MLFSFENYSSLNGTSYLLKNTVGEGQVLVEEIFSFLFIVSNTLSILFLLSGKCASLIVAFQKLVRLILSKADELQALCVMIWPLLSVCLPSLLVTYGLLFVLGD